MISDYVVPRLSALAGACNGAQALAAKVSHSAYVKDSGPPRPMQLEHMTIVLLLLGFQVAHAEQKLSPPAAVSDDQQMLHSAALQGQQAANSRHGSAKHATSWPLCKGTLPPM